MASLTPLLSTASLVLLLLSCLPASHGSTNGFSLELIPSFSPRSPLFKFTNQSRLESSHDASIGSINSSLIVTPPIYEISAFVVQVGLGTFDASSPSASHYKSYYLVMDTASSLTWTQCEDCKLEGNYCYEQKEPVFPNKESKTYKPVTCDRRHPRCDKCTGGQCVYSLGYLDGDSSSGVLARETFTFPSSSSSRTEAIPDVLFGCGLRNKDSKQGSEYEIAGVFGLGRKERSFVKQIQRQSGGKFSYCLTNAMQNPPPRMYLRFGADVRPAAGDFKTIDMLQNGRRDGYYVKLVDLGVNGERVGIDPVEFRIKADGSGGSVVDSGSTCSYVIAEAYKELEKKMVEYFKRQPEFRRCIFKRGKWEGRFCYLRKKGVEGFKKVPGMNWYFEGGVSMDVGAEGTFWRELWEGKELFCMMILPDDKGVTTLGAYQQLNHRFIYDTLHNKLQFGPHDCARDA